MNNLNTDTETTRDLRPDEDGLPGHIRDYMETYIKLTVAKTTQKSADFAAIGATGMLGLMFFLLIMLFVGVGFALWLGDVLQNAKAGYFIVAGAYALLSLIIIGFRNQLMFPFIRNYIVKKAYD